MKLWKQTPIRKQIDPAELAAKRRVQALLLCQNARNLTSWQMADRLAKAWLGPDCGCESLGVKQPPLTPSP